MRHLDLFSGIGGFALAARNVGWETVGFCEIDPYCQKVLAKHWPGVPIYEDVRNVTAERLRADGITADIITGGFPCTDISVAGKQAGIGKETRSGLWSELARIIGEVRPRYAVLENVSALLSGDSGRWFQRVIGDLAEIGYDCEWHCIPASAVGAPHRRDRVWIIAYPNECEWGWGTEWRQGRNGKSEFYGAEGDVADTSSTRREIRLPGQEFWQEGVTRITNHIGHGFGGAYPEAGMDWWTVEPNVGRVANGIPKRVDRLKGLGNAIVPQVAEVIFRAIEGMK